MFFSLIAVLSQITCTLIKHPNVSLHHGSKDFPLQVILAGWRSELKSCLKVFMSLKCSDIRWENSKTECLIRCLICWNQILQTLFIKLVLHGMSKKKAYEYLNVPFLVCSHQKVTMEPTDSKSFPLMFSLLLKLELLFLLPKRNLLFLCFCFWFCVCIDKKNIFQMHIKIKKCYAL